jgi:lipopolysaccharide transport system permease protein
MLINKEILNLKNQILLSIKNFFLIKLFFFNTLLLITRRTFFGYLWLFLKPAVPLTVYAFVFGIFMSVDKSVEVPYLIFLLYGYITWSIFDETLYWTTRSYDGNKNIIKRVSLPFLLIPIASSFVGLTLSLTSLFYLVIACSYYYLVEAKIYFEIGLGNFAIAILSTISIYIFSLGMGFILSIINTKFRDIKFITKIILSGWLFLTPVMYPLSKVPQDFQYIFLLLNPISISVLNFRDSLLHGSLNISYELIFFNFLICLMTFIIGLNYHLIKIRQGLIIR